MGTGGGPSHLDALLYWCAGLHLLVISREGDDEEDSDEKIVLLVVN